MKIEISEQDVTAILQAFTAQAMTYKKWRGESAYDENFQRWDAKYKDVKSASSRFLEAYGKAAA